MNEEVTERSELDEVMTDRAARHLTPVRCLRSSWLAEITPGYLSLSPQ